MKKERIEDDWIRKEKIIQWRLKKKNMEERRRNKKTEVRYAKIWMAGK